MSTKPIRRALEILKTEANSKGPSLEDSIKGETMHDAYTAALEAVRAIEEMARSIVANGGTYTLVGAREASVAEAQLLESIAKEAP